jgi:MoaA/NifB/PqqE/SkfB family radical SAM enzyme
MEVKVIASRWRTLALAKRALGNYLLKKPLCISFEITHCCNANCKHCHLGGLIKENRASADKLGRICSELNPLVAQISGGEPLLRDDLEEIVSAFKRPNRAPYIDITTNGILLNKERYTRLRLAGIDKFSISLDYPDSRHDVFRGFPGLFLRIEKLAAELNGEKDKAIVLICVVKNDNYRDMIRLAELAADWNVKINFSAYTWLRTNNKGYLLDQRQIKELQDIIIKLIKINSKSHHIFTTKYGFDRMVRFFVNQSIPSCAAGYRFFNVNPDGTISPCGLIIKDFNSPQELQQNFSRKNKCTFCYTSMRINAEKPAFFHIKEKIPGSFFKAGSQD